MRAVSFVKRLQWDVPGTIFRHGMSIGDVDNDGDNELVVGTAEGELYIFKGTDLWQKIHGLGLITSLTIGDIFNYGRNALVVICGDGWVHVFYSPRPVNPAASSLTSLGLLPSTLKDIGTVVNNPYQDHSTTANTTGGISSGATIAPTSVDVATGMSSMINSGGSEQLENLIESSEPSGKMQCVHVQRIPTNTKVVLLADIDKDGAVEMIIGLTDRVVRSYRWSSNADIGSGRLVGLNKWECADQIGTVTLQHAGDGTPTLLVAQPGGTFMRIKCNSEDDCHFIDNDKSESVNEVAASCVDYQTLGISRMRNPNISTEILGDLEPGRDDISSSVEGGEILPNYKREKKETIYSMDDSKILTNDLKPSSLEFRRNYSQPEMLKSSIDGTDRDHKEFFTPYSDKIFKYQAVNSTDEKETSFDTVDGNIVGGNVVLGEFDIQRDEKKKSFLPGHKDFSKSFIHNEGYDKGKDNKEDEIDKKFDKDKNSDNESGNRKGKPYALATLDGTIMLVQDEVILWAMQVDHQIFALCRLDVTGDGTDEIVACAWDGQTYMLDQKKNSVRFQFEEPVRAFCTGKYSIGSGSSSPCLVYNTFHNKIFLYHDVVLPSMMVSALNVVEELNETEKEILDNLMSKDNEIDDLNKIRLITEWLLYGNHYL